MTPLVELAFDGSHLDHLPERLLGAQSPGAGHWLNPLAATVSPLTVCA
jgi:hypothetical protein